MERPLTNRELLKPPFMPAPSAAVLTVRGAVLASPRYQSALANIKQAIAASWRAAEAFVATFEAEARPVHEFVSTWDAERCARELRALELPAVAGAFRRGLKQVCLKAS